MNPIPTFLAAVGEDLALVWPDGVEHYLPLQTLRRLCPCAGCAGEGDFFGRVARPPQKPYTTESFQLRDTAPVGGYAVQLFWGDGHSDGFYPYEKLRAWGESPPALPKLSVSPLLPSL
ncbi:MAG: DUF971 domain-containing protein [Acidobacteria bacterium]|nr:DUF971 domain-containing protein [Acidobacteriota bacterium]